MAQITLESILKSTPDSIKRHKTASFIAGAALYASSLYLDYKVWTSFKEGNLMEAAAYLVAGRVPSLSGIALMGAPAWFYYSSKIVGKRRMVKAIRQIQKIKGFASDSSYSPHHKKGYSPSFPIGKRS